MSSSSVRRCVAAVAAVALGAGLTAALAGPASAASSAISEEQFAAELSFGATATRAALVSGGGASTMAVPGVLSSRDYLVVDASRRSARLTLPFRARDLRVAVGSSGIPLPFGNPCTSGLFSLDPTAVVRDGVGRYVPITKDSASVLRKGRRLVGEPKARWLLKPSRKATLDRFVATEDPVAELAAEVAGDDAVPGGGISVIGGLVISEPSREELPGGGTRLRASYTEFGEITGDLRVDLGADGRAISLSRTQAVAGQTFEQIVTYRYGARSVALPRASSVVKLKKLRPGCAAVLVEEVVRDLPKVAAKQLNRRATKKKPVTVAKVRRFVGRLIVGYSERGIRDNDVPGGAEIVGNAKLLDGPVRARVIVVDGRAVVRRNG